MPITRHWTAAFIAVPLLFAAPASAVAARTDPVQAPVEAPVSDQMLAPAALQTPGEDLTVTLEPNAGPPASEPDAPACDVTKPKDRQAFRSIAMRFIGTPYRWGGTTPNAFDCSGFTRYVYRQMGVKLPRTAREQYRVGEPVKQGQWETGDLVFFDMSKGYVSHVGLYLAANTFIHASNPLSGVKLDNLGERAYRRHYVGARRYDVT